MKTILVSAAILAATVVPATAQEASNFDGVKVGAVIGYDKVRLSYEDVYGTSDGVLYGITAGYDVDLGAAVIGIEGEVTDSGMKESITDLLIAGDRISLAATRDLYIGARVGIPVSPTVLLYAKAGYTNAGAKLSYSYDGITLSENDDLSGYRVGAGVEVTNGSSFARLEYRYSDYGKYAYKGFETGIKAERHQVAATGGFRF